MPGYPSIFDSSTEWSLNAVAQMFPCKWVRELAEENRNKFHAFSEFQNTKRSCSGPDLPPDLFAIPRGISGARRDWERISPNSIAVQATPSF